MYRLTIVAFASALSAAPNKKAYCNKEVSASVKGQKAECQKQWVTATTAAGKDKDKRKEATEAKKSCVKAADDSKKMMMESCMTAGAEAN